MNVHRYYIPNAIVFITQVVDQRMPVFHNEVAVALLRTTLHKVIELHPFVMLGYVFLPDHFHLLIRPTGDSNFSQIMHSLKPNFTKAYKEMIGAAGPMKFWQKGFWDHIIRDEADFERHLDYIHYNPVHHQLVERPEEWPDSSFMIWKQRDFYADHWGWSLPDTLDEHVWRSADGDRERQTPKGATPMRG